ncbi:MAG: YeeE/YedE family protein [Rhodothermia bacterium]|nr:YeeE/YedE family protein [Rhodothermia bacterium]
MQTIDYPPTTDATAAQEAQAPPKDGLLKYLIVGIFFGIVLTKSEVISWFRIQEMFRFQAFHMYGVIGAAVAVAALSVYLIKKRQTKSFNGDAIKIQPKDWGKGYRYWIGGTIFGLGWALTGACPGPIFALLGNGVLVMAVALLGALAGTWTYAALRPKLPH